MMKIFVSYASEDLEHLNMFESEIKRLSPMPIEVLSDKLLGLGEHKNDIFRLIKSSDAQVLIISRRFIEKSNDYIEDEITYIMGHLSSIVGKKRNLFPVAETDFDPKVCPEKLKTLLGKFTIINLHSNYPEIDKLGESQWKRVAQVILRKLDITPKEDLSLLDFKQAIHDGRFVPFIGPECYGLKEAWQPAFSLLHARLKELEDRLSRNRDKQFVRALIESRVPGFDSKKLTQNEVTEDEKKEFINLRVAIVEAAAAASRILGRSLSQCEHLIDTRFFNIKINVDDEEVKILRRALKTAMTCAVDLSMNDCLNQQEDRMCIGANGIASKLDFLQKVIFSSDTLDENISDDKTNASLVLTLPQLDWLNDLLWHTIRFDAPVLPRTDELAFKVSVCQATQCLVRVPLGTAGVISRKASPDDASMDRKSVVRGQEPCTKLIYQQLDDLQKTKFSRQSEFYRAIAKLIWQPFSKPQPDMSISGTRSSSVEFVDEAVSYDGSKPRYPMVISVNMDEELERYLQNVEHSVIYPVQRFDGKASAWMLRVRVPNNEDKFYLLSKDAQFERDVKKVVKGPLIVKLRGSPLHKLPTKAPQPLGKANEDIGRIAQLENRVLLSSLDYTRALSDLGKLGQPNPVRELLREEERVLCFFGHPLDDSDGLLSIQRSVWVAETACTAVEFPSNRISVGCDRHDGLGHAFLSKLKVEPLGIDLNKVAEEINKIPGLVNLPDAKR